MDVKVFECAGKRYRMTPQRKAVLDVLRRSNSQADALSVYEEVRKVVPNISLGTVYRTLSLLREAGFIKETEAAGPDVRGDATTRIHCHARCVTCSRTVDLRVDVGADLEAQATSATGFVITGHHLEFYGLCPGCAEQRGTQPG